MTKIGTRVWAIRNEDDTTVHAYGLGTYIGDRLLDGWDHPDTLRRCRASITKHDAEALREHGDHAVMAGLLHDIVEDTPVTLDQLRHLGYPEEVVAAVDSVTRREGPQYPDGREPYMDLIRRAAADPLGRLVKLEDNKNNSDPARLALLTPDEREWFTQKYARAREVLLGEGNA